MADFFGQITSKPSQTETNYAQNVLDCSATEDVKGIKKIQAQEEKIKNRVFAVMIDADEIQKPATAVHQIWKMGGKYRGVGCCRLEPEKGKKNLGVI